MRRMAIVLTICFAAFFSTAQAEPLLVPVGQTVGLQLRDNTVTIAAFDDSLGSQARDAGLKIGDLIVKVNGKAVHNTDEVRSILNSSGSPASLLIRRGSKELELPVKITPTDSGAKLGVYLKQGITGIGTVTWYDPATGRFGALGHGVNGTGGVLLRMAQGTTYPAQVQSVTKGKSGRPGQLKGSCDDVDACGELLRNTPQGVFGKSSRGWLGEPIPIAAPEQVHPGQATIRSTVNGSATGDYSAEILKVYPASRADGRNLLLKITDPTLLETTGGIVQGM